MAYTKTNWVNNTTPINATNLNKIEDELEILDKDINYSTTEQVIGTWITGKPLYRKAIDCGSLPNATSKTKAHNISNIDMITKCEGIAYRSGDGYFFPLPFASTTLANTIQVMSTKENIIIIDGIDRSNTVGYIVLEYTKTTD